jgi:ComF family protein
MRLVEASRAAVSRLAAIARGALDAALPQRCAACGRDLAGGGLLCTACLAAIPVLSLGVCVRCLAAGREPVGCPRHRDFTVWPAWVYDRRAEAVVHALKFGGRPGLAATLAAPLARAAAHLSEAGIVTEVPLHRARLRERGYNQASLLADALSGALGVPRSPGLLVRTRATRAQARLGARARRDNLAGCFRVARPEWTRGRQVVVVDDVVTSGATLEACLECLADAGASPVAVALAWAQ